MTDAPLSPDHWSRVQELFHAALLRAETERPAFLAEACRDAPSLRFEVEALLHAHQRGGLVRTLDVAGRRSVDGPLPPPGPVAPIAQSLAGRYAVDRPIGAGGMATVYLARDLKHERLVAVKVLRSEVASIIGARRFLQEIKVTANLQHPHILPLHDSGDADGHLYYVMPFVSGASLRHRINAVGRLEPAQALRVSDGVAAALEYAHGHGVVHRDIKPENILLHEGTALVADFGIALVLSGVDPGRLTQTGLPIGTPNYMSPEQARGDPVDGRTDLYALGCVLYECLAGEPPYRGTTPLVVVAQHLTGPVPSLSATRPDLSPALGRAIAVAMAKDPAGRFARVADFATAVRAHLAGEPAAAVQEHPRAAAAVTPPMVKTPTALDQAIRFCSTADGVKIAWASVGTGPPLVKAANWLSHLEFDWQSPMWRHWWEGLARYHRLVRYDERGCGLSDWKAADMTLGAWVGDLEAVVDAAGLDRFALLGISQGGAIAVSYAVRHPEKVTHLILHGAYARGRLARTAPEQKEQAELEINLVRLGWGQQNPAFRQVFSTMFFPDASPEELRWLNELQTASASADNAARIMRGFQSIDVRETATHVTAPTLVLHAKGDGRVPFEEGRHLASLIPGARFVPLDSNNHIPLEHEPAWAHFLDAVWTFLGVSEPA